jgi:hypothetical protein
MSKKGTDLTVIADLLGEDFMASLEKAELYKPETGSTVSHEELADALKVVPRAVMAWLTRNLADMKVGENRQLDVPFKRAENCAISLSKVSTDVYHGEVMRSGKILYRFKYRTIPGIGLILLTTFELYDLDQLEKDQLEREKESYLSSMIEERVALRSLVSQVIAEQMSQRSAIDALIRLRMTAEIKKEAINPAQAEQAASAAPEEAKPEEPKAEAAPAEEGPKPATKADKLKEFIETQKKLKKSEAGYTVHLLKGESVSCPDCKQKLFDGKSMTGCLCYGSDMGRKVFLKKNENGTMTVKFSKGWDPENVQMLLEALKRREK